jgi:hypothetical protein
MPVVRGAAPFPRSRGLARFEYFYTSFKILRLQGRSCKNADKMRTLKIILVYDLILTDFFKKCESDQQRYGILANKSPCGPISPTEAFFPAS